MAEAQRRLQKRDEINDRSAEGAKHSRVKQLLPRATPSWHLQDRKLARTIKSGSNSPIQPGGLTSLTRVKQAAPHSERFPEKRALKRGSNSPIQPEGKTTQTRVKQLLHKVMPSWDQQDRRKHACK
ncbi:hypothetical protein DPMN_070026 [Dreissena polymorpha]|uniref:Uncharacterized protein n=1 Tax=Dreissena polymorpha TaxID=45954 RepID=A0A9D3Z287_DREPO|nr:hypothetical protein DPMN_070026 [Dreissena polymorpha]